MDRILLILVLGAKIKASQLLSLIPSFDFQNKYDLENFENSHI